MALFAFFFLFAIQRFLVEHIFAQAGARAFQISNMIGQQFHLLNHGVNEFPFQNIRQLKNKKTFASKIFSILVKGIPAHQVCLCI